MLSALVIQANPNNPQWFGPQTVTFDVAVPGNAYDPSQNDLVVRFYPKKGKPVERLAYAASDGTIKATLVAQERGKYHPVLVRNGKELLSHADEGDIDLERPLPKGFIHIDQAEPTRLRWDSGERYFPLGFNLGWQNPAIAPMPEQLAKMGAVGINWSRIWACDWDGKNPWWPQSDPNALKDQLWSPALKKWAGLVDAGEHAGVSFQMVMFHHGGWSSTTDAEWPRNPWNVKNGGFLKDAGDFFTDPEAKRRAKMWLRYAVARYSASPAILSWELFNEVQWVDAVHENRWPDIVAWHNEMAGYLRSIDPYHHLITTSSVLEPKNLWANMDYFQPHTYPPDVLMAINGFDMPQGKPGFFGEYGPSGDWTKADIRVVVRDGIYGAMLSGQAGVAQFWGWDSVDQKDLYGEYRTAALVLKDSGLPNRPGARKLVPVVSTIGAATLSFGPGGGWERAGKTTFDLPADAEPSSVAKLPAYLQSLAGSNKALFPEPLRFRFVAPKAGLFRLRIAEVSKAGASIGIIVNGTGVVSKNLVPGATQPLEAAYPAGAVDIRVKNSGADWIRMAGFDFEGLAPQAHALAIGESDWMVIRLTRAQGVVGLPVVTVRNLSATDGDYDLETVNLDTGSADHSTTTLRAFALGAMALVAKDEVLILKKKQ